MSVIDDLRSQGKITHWIIPWRAAEKDEITRADIVEHTVL
jgi:hypothetical protein